MSRHSAQFRLVFPDEDLLINTGGELNQITIEGLLAIKRKKKKQKFAETFLRS